ncbi:hypothetical protein Ancab_013767 [Ancistrocladus abbreviatus]
MEKEGADGYYKSEVGNGNLPFNSGVSYADMVRRLPQSKQFQGRNGDVQMQQQQSQCLEEGRQKEGISECETQVLDVIHTKVCIKVDEDVFFVIVAEESVDVADRIGGFEPVRGGNDNTASPPSLSINIVPDSFGQDIAGDHILGSVLPPQVAVHISKCNAEK